MRKRLLAILLSGCMLFGSGMTAVAAELPEMVMTETEEETEQETEQPETENPETEATENFIGNPIQIPTEQIPAETEQMTAAIAAAKAALEQLLADRVVMATVYLTDYYPVKVAAGVGQATVAELPSGSMVLIRGVEFVEGQAWYLVSFGYEDAELTGYIEDVNLIATEENFMAWQQEYLTAIGGPAAIALVRGNEDILQFPASYQAALYQLKTQHPNWTFVPMRVMATWSQTVTEEMCVINGNPRSQVHVSKPDAWKGERFDNNWYAATQEALEYCLDPRNFLTENYIFMFEQLTYNRTYHTAEAVQKILSGSFMSGQIPDEGITYAQAFYNIGSSLGVSPFHLACRVYQEQGSQGTSPLISGKYSGYEGYYNYFNIGATGAGIAAVTSGLTYAKEHGWNTRLASLTGGAQLISNNYILKGQDTLYLQKFDVDPTFNGMFSHQYMQNITAPQTEGARIRQAYANAGALDNVFVFKIPVYDGMPEQPCPEPGTAVSGMTPEQENQVREFIIRLYELVLGRTPETFEVEDWLQKLKTKVNDGAGVAYGFFFSNEFKNNGVPNEEFVRILYRVMLSREADDAGLADWTGQLAIGMSREHVFQGFANSAEFAQLCGFYGIERGTYVWDAYRDQNQGVTAFVNRLYEKVLDRTGDENGLEDWCRKIICREDTMENVAYGFVFSEEFLKKDVDTEKFVTIMYRTFLNRDPDPEGFADWTGQLSQGVSRLQVFQGFSGSLEFRKLMEEYGVN